MSLPQLVALVLLCATLPLAQAQHSWYYSEDGCMQTEGLQQVLQTATYMHATQSQQASDPATLQRFGPQTAIMLTSCNHHCLEYMLPVFMEAAQRNKLGSFAQHLVVIALGQKAYDLCLEQANKYGHQCLLDRLCMPLGKPPGVSTSMHYNSPHYLVALAQKLFWASEIMHRGVSVLWVDLDIIFFYNPLRYLFDVAPQADVVTQTEHWLESTIFKGDVCRFTTPGSGCKGDGTQNDEAVDPDTGVSLCCANSVNGGLWLMRANARGTALMKAWVATYFEQAVVHGRMWNGTTTHDQQLLNDMFSNRHEARTLVTPTYTWDSQAARYITTGNITRHHDEAIYRISAQRCANLCSHSPCGWMGPGQGFPARWVKNEQGEDQQLVCTMPKKWADRLISYHVNCEGNLDIKLRVMRGFQNWTVDEAAFAEQGLTVRPDW